MENKIEEYMSPVDLCEEDPFNRGYQARIVLEIDWENQTIGAKTVYGNGYPYAVHNRTMSWITLPNNLDARYLKRDIDAIMPRIERIAAGFDTEWDGHNYIGKFTNEDELIALIELIETDDGEIITRFYDGGLWDAADWFQEPVKELKPTTPDDELRFMAEVYTDDAYCSGIIIAGGVPATERLFRIQRDEMRENE